VKAQYFLKSNKINRTSKLGAEQGARFVFGGDKPKYRLTILSMPAWAI
jgi:hypothetical protein